jgi:release factor glutamine methyltransferase
LGAKINFFTDDLLTKPSTYNFILANLPYVPKNYSVSPEVLAEPKTAVFADDNGLALINKLALQAITSLNPGGFILLESLLQQQTDLNKYYQAAGFKLINKLGLVQVFQKPFSSE